MTPKLTTTVDHIHKHKGDRTKATYCGRPTIYGNPFPITPERGRRQVIEDYREWFYGASQTWLRMRATRELAGMVLLCWCHPLPCHCDVIADYLNNGDGR